MKHEQAPQSKGIKNYFETLKASCGKTNKMLAVELGVTPVTISNLSARLDTMAGDKIKLLAIALGVEPEIFFRNVMTLRENPSYEVEI